MTGHELLAALTALPDEVLDLPVLAVTVNRLENEGAWADASPPPGEYPWLPTPVLKVASIDATLSHLWASVVFRSPPR